jgi:hypothetical protein
MVVPWIAFAVILAIYLYVERGRPGLWARLVVSLAALIAMLRSPCSGGS